MYSQRLHCCELCLVGNFKRKVIFVRKENFILFYNAYLPYHSGKESDYIIIYFYFNDKICSTDNLHDYKQIIITYVEYYIIINSKGLF